MRFLAWNRKQHGIFMCVKPVMIQTYRYMIQHGSTVKAVFFL